MSNSEQKDRAAENRIFDIYFYPHFISLNFMPLHSSPFYYLVLYVRQFGGGDRRGGVRDEAGDGLAAGQAAGRSAAGQPKLQEGCWQGLA